MTRFLIEVPQGYKVLVVPQDTPAPLAIDAGDLKGYMRFRDVLKKRVNDGASIAECYNDVYLIELGYSAMDYRLLHGLGNDGPLVAQLVGDERKHVLDRMRLYVDIIERDDLGSDAILELCRVGQNQLKGATLDQFPEAYEAWRRASARGVEPRSHRFPRS